MAEGAVVNERKVLAHLFRVAVTGHQALVVSKDRRLIDR